MAVRRKSKVEREMAKVPLSLTDLLKSHSHSQIKQVFVQRHASYATEDVSEMRP
jgi:hypothetical protein